VRIGWKKREEKRRTEEIVEYGVDGCDDDDDACWDGE
jgi:hypothetical protein